jgi:cation/acetate symporter
LLTLYWKRFNEIGALAGMASGFLASVILLIFGPHVMNPDNGWIAREPIFPLYNPGIIAIPVGFLGAVLGALLARRPLDHSRFSRLVVRAQTGIDPQDDAGGKAMWNS